MLRNLSIFGAEILRRLLPVDGAGSGLDADKLDGMEAGDFLDALWPPAHTAGVRYFSPIYSPYSGATAAGPYAEIWTHPFPLRHPSQFAWMQIQIATAGQAGELVRLGLYADSGSASPGELLMDSGDLSSSSTGFRSASLSGITLPRGWVWLAVASNAPSAGGGSARFYTCGSAAQWVSQYMLGASTNGYKYAHTYGPLPASLAAAAKTAVYANNYVLSLTK